MEATEFIRELGKALEEKGELRTEIQKLSQERGQFIRDIGVYKKLKQDLEKEFNELKEEHTKEMNELKTIVEDLRNKRASLVSSLSPEMQRLTTLSDKTKAEMSATERKIEELDMKSKSLALERVNFEEKKNILKQIKELIEKL